MFTRSFLGYHFDEGLISVVGDGDAKLNIVTRADCSRFVAHVLVTATKRYLEGAQLSFLIIFSIPCACTRSSRDIFSF